MIAALPGLREIRSALAGGYLWLLFLWLLLDPALGRSDFIGEPFRSARHVSEALGPVAKGVATTFVAYLIGTFVNEGRNVTTRLYLYARQSEDFTPDVASSRISRRLEERRRLKSRRHPWTVSRKSFVRELIEDSPSFRTSRLQPRPPLVLRAAVRVVELFEEFGSMLGAFARGASTLVVAPIIVVEVAGLALLRAIIAMRAEPYRPFLTQRGVSALEKYLESLVLPRASESLPSIADVITDFPVIRARLLHTSMDTVNEVDRLTSEAEFRSSIVAPLTFLLVLLAVNTSLIWLLLWPVLLTLLSAARERRREAGDLLVDALRQGVVRSPSIDAYSDAQQASVSDSETLADSPHQRLIW